MKFAFSLLMTLGLTINLPAQNSINNYKYIILPKKFEFLSQADQYRLNTQTRYLLKKKGFDVFYNDEALPDEVATNNCTALKANIVKINSLLRTKLQLELRDCRNKVLYLSEEGVSREKQFGLAYKEALEKTFAYFDLVEYNYTPKAAEVSSNAIPKSQNTKERIVDDAPTKSEKIEVTKVEPEVKEKLTETKKNPEIIRVVEMREDKAEQKEEVVTNIEETKDKTKEKGRVRTNAKLKSDVLVASLEGNKYLVSDGNELLMTLYFTPLPDVYIVQGKDAILFKRGNNWILSESDDNQMSGKILKIDFQ
jgi:hypothetical protein